MLRKAVILLILLVCPWVVSYGQLHFAGVNGERGYAALRGDYRLTLDNGLSLLPSVGYYRRSDTEEDEAGATTKFALAAEYEVLEGFFLALGASYIPKRLGFQNVSYGVTGKYVLAYRYGIFKYPYIGFRFGQTRYRIDSDVYGNDLPQQYKTYATQASLTAGSELGRFVLQAQYDKVIKYNNNPPSNITSNWTDIPFMTAVVQGFVSDIAAARLAYRTKWITPYAVYSRYRYMVNSDYTVSVAGGLALHLGESTLSGGVEVFEQNREENRKTYFFMSASTEF